MLGCWAKLRETEPKLKPANPIIWTWKPYIPQAIWSALLSVYPAIRSPVDVAHFPHRGKALPLRECMTLGLTEICLPAPHISLHKVHTPYRLAHGLCFKRHWVGIRFYFSKDSDPFAINPHPFRLICHQSNGIWGGTGLVLKERAFLPFLCFRGERNTMGEGLSVQ